MSNKRKDAEFANVRWLKSQPAAPAFTKIDRENGVLHDVVMCQVGEAKGHDVNLEQSFIDDLVAYANENHQKNGLKARLGHPSMSNQTMGTQLGSFNNFRVSGNQAVADLTLLDAASKSPNGDLKEWVLSMAEEDPNFIMSSIVFKASEYYRYDADGKLFNDSQEEYYNLTSEKYVKLDSLMNCDLVEQGAATESLFSAQFNKDKFAVQVNEFLNENPKIDTFIKENPAKIVTLFKQRGIEFEEKGLLDKIKSLFKSEEDNDEFDRIVLDNQKLSDDLAASIDTNAKVQSAQLEMQRLIDEKDAALEASETRIKELEKLIEGIDLNHFPKTPAEKTKQKPLWHKDNFEK